MFWLTIIGSNSLAKVMFENKFTLNTFVISSFFKLCVSLSTVNVAKFINLMFFNNFLFCKTNFLIFLSLLRSNLRYSIFFFLDLIFLTLAEFLKVTIISSYLLKSATILLAKSDEPPTIKYRLNFHYCCSC